MDDSNFYIAKEARENSWKKFETITNQTLGKDECNFDDTLVGSIGWNDRFYQQRSFKLRMSFRIASFRKQ